MRGEILTYSDTDGRGFISGDDGVRYSFQRSDMQQLQPLAAGMRVDFQPDGEAAREIFLLQAQPQAATTPTATFVMDVTEDHPSTRHHLGMWGYFKKCMAMYVNAHGRATRGEYWSFVFFSYVFMLVPLILGFATAGEEFYEYGENPSAQAVVFFLLTGIACLAFCLPGLCVTIRRLHDCGMSGWLFLINFVPYIGGLILFIFMVIPGQRGPNKHGPDPQVSKPGYAMAA